MNEEQDQPPYKRLLESARRGAQELAEVAMATKGSEIDDVERVLLEAKMAVTLEAIRQTAGELKKELATLIKEGRSTEDVDELEDLDFQLEELIKRTRPE